MRERVRVRVPATTANLGPGFDCLGMALELYNDVAVELREGLDFAVNGYGATSLPRDKRNLVYRALALVFEKAGTPVPGMRIFSWNAVPPARGLGSSAAAVVGGMVAANLLIGEKFSGEELLAFAAGIEGHPDNVAPAIFGGCQAVARDGDRFARAPVPVPKSLLAVLFTPQFEMPTKKARVLLPPQVSREDAVFNLARVAFLVRALTTGEMEYLREGTQDRLHQPARRALFPAMEKLFSAALDAGARGAFLSGAGSSILAFSDDEKEAFTIARALEKAAAALGVEGHSLVTRPSPRGAEEMPWKEE
jgi:homoserine kinase